MSKSMLDLHNHLMSQIETLGDEELEGEKLQEAIQRAGAMTKVASTVISNASLVMQAEKMRLDYGDDNVPAMLTGPRSS